MAQNFVQERSDALTKYTANLVSDHRVYMEELPSQAKRNGYRPTKTLTSEDKQRMQWNKVHYVTVPWFDITQGEEMSVFTASTKGARLLKRLATKARIFLRIADLAFLTTAHEMHLQRRTDDLVDTCTKMLPSGSKVTFSTSQESGVASAGGTSSRRSSARRTSSYVQTWSKEYVYGSPMTRQRFSPYMAIWDPDVLEELGVNLTMVGDFQLEERWALHPNEVHHSMEALRQAGTGTMTDGESEWNNGKSMVCEICGGRWQRLERARPDTNVSVVTGERLRPFEIGIPLPLHPGSQWSLEAVTKR